MKILRFQIGGSPNHPLNIFVLIMNTIQLLGLPPFMEGWNPLFLGKTEKFIPRKTRLIPSFELGST